MTVYIAMTLGAFLVVVRMRDADGQPVEAIASLSGLSRSRPWLAGAMAIFMFSLAGIPPLFGFWPKLVVFQAAVAADITWLAAVAIATSVIGAYYYIMIVKLMYFDEPAPAFAIWRDPVGSGLILVMALFVSPLGLSRHPPARPGDAGGGGGLVLIRTVAETGSTNDDVARLAREGAAEGLWLRADRQTGGKGRQGRAWISPPGNLHASTLIRLREGDPPAASLALVAAVALHEVVAVYAPGVQIKWPNDLLFNGAKLAGILLEREDDAVIFGFGVNLAHHPDGLDRPATSLVALAGLAPEPEPFLEILARAFARRLERWREEGLAPIRAAWLAAAHPIGTPLSTSEGEGLFEGLDEEGALILRLADGTARVIHAGDVFLLSGETS